MNNLKIIIQQRSLIWELAKHKLREQYAATLIGSFWAVLQPLMTMLVFWFVFTYGFRQEVSEVNQAPFFLVLFCGLLPWMSFNEALQAGTQSILAHQYLVKKIVFPLEILPIAQITASIVVHLYMIGFLILMLCIYGIWPNLFFLQSLYYLFAMIMLVTGLAWLFSALNVFHRDIGQTLNLVLMLWFWLTPIVWPAKNLPPKLLSLVQLNPMYYIVEGYRKSFLYHEGFWQDWTLGLYFWTFCLLMFWIGFVFFNRVKVQFSDVL